MPTSLELASHRIFAASCGLAGLLCASATGCNGSAGTKASDASRPLAVVVSCDTAGWIVPCGCSSKQAGGLLRRATYVAGLRQSADVLLLDAGGAPGGVSPYDRAKFAAVLRGEAEMQTGAHNIGAAEAALGVESLRELAESLRVPFVSSNVRDAQGQAFVGTHRLVTSGRQRVAVLGVLSPGFASRELQIDEPSEAVRKLLPTLKNQYDLLVVLAYLPEDELQAFVGRVPEVDIVVGGPTRQSIAPRQAGPTVWAAATNKGKFLVHLEQQAPRASWDGRIVELGPDIADDALQSQNLSRFRDELAHADFRSNQTGFSPDLPVDVPADFRVAGTEACVKCHRDDCDNWRETRHARAWQTLVEKRSEVDPYCQHCHSTGYGLPGGFVSLASAAERANVGCESCHGPSSAHASRPEARTSYDARDRCRTCHDHDNSPRFDYDSFWAMIEHGVPATAGKDK